MEAVIAVHAQTACLLKNLLHVDLLAARPSGLPDVPLTLSAPVQSDKQPT